jgi:hypothetical protein
MGAAADIINKTELKGKQIDAFLRILDDKGLHFSARGVHLSVLDKASEKAQKTMQQSEDINAAIDIALKTIRESGFPMQAHQLADLNTEDILPAIEKRDIFRSFGETLLREQSALHGNPCISRTALGEYCADLRTRDSQLASDLQKAFDQAFEAALEVSPGAKTSRGSSHAR